MTAEEKNVMDIRIAIVIAAYMRELIDYEIQYEFFNNHTGHTPEGKRKLLELNEKMKKRHEQFMSFGEAPYKTIDHYSELFCSVEKERVGLS